MRHNEGLWPGLAYPRVPGHEIAGHIDAVGANVIAWRPGQRVGVGWHGGHCFVCAPCRRGDFAMCVHRQVTGFDFDGGYAEETLAFSVLSAVHPMIEQYPLGRVAEAFEQMHSGRVRFRVVLTVDA
jgi:D-arabinose 1-dehydrogenase-like Zn-dependent alcohol dehydrogenase